MLRTDNRPVVDLADVSWRARFARAAEAQTDVERRALEESVRAGDATRLRRGVYRVGPPTPHPDERHRDLVRAASIADEVPKVFSHRSAAALWRLPRLDPWPERVELVERSDTVRRSTPGLRRYLTDEPVDTAVVETITTTTIDRAAIDVARVDGYASAVATIDGALRGIRLVGGGEVRADRERMSTSLERLRGRRGIETARAALAFADGLAETAGESLSRVQIHRCGLSRPILQARFDDEWGSLFPDFYWPDLRIAGEFDGLLKYVGGSDAVYRERRREDRFLRLGVRYVRWDWTTARSRHLLEARLRAFGVR